MLARPCAHSVWVPISFITQGGLWYARATDAQLLPPHFHATSGGDDPQALAEALAVTRREILGWMAVGGYCGLVGLVLMSPAVKVRTQGLQLTLDERRAL